MEVDEPVPVPSPVPVEKKEQPVQAAAPPQSTEFDRLLNLTSNDFMEQMKKDINIGSSVENGKSFIQYVIEKRKIDKLRIIVKYIRPIKLSTMYGTPPSSALTRILTIASQEDKLPAERAVPEEVRLRTGVYHRYSKMPETRLELGEMVAAWDTVDMNNEYNKEVFDTTMTKLAKEKNRTRENLSKILRDIATERNYNNIKNYF
jgi:hypothetical protein